MFFGGDFHTEKNILLSIMQDNNNIKKNTNVRVKNSFYEAGSDGADRFVCVGLTMSCLCQTV